MIEPSSIKYKYDKATKHFIASWTRADGTRAAYFVRSRMRWTFMVAFDLVVEHNPGDQFTPRMLRRLLEKQRSVFISQSTARSVLRELRDLNILRGKKTKQGSVRVYSLRPRSDWSPLVGKGVKSQYSREISKAFRRVFNLHTIALASGGQWYVSVNNSPPFPVDGNWRTVRDNAKQFIYANTSADLTINNRKVEVRLYPSGVDGTQASIGNEAALRVWLDTNGYELVLDDAPHYVARKKG